MSHIVSKICAELLHRALEPRGGHSWQLHIGVIWLSRNCDWRWVGGDGSHSSFWMDLQLRKIDGSLFDFVWTKLSSFLRVRVREEGIPKYGRHTRSTLALTLTPSHSHSFQSRALVRFPIPITMMEI